MKNLVSKFGLDSAKDRRTPIETHDTRDELGIGVDQTLYRSMIGILLYLNTSHYNLCCSRGVCARYQASSKESHLLAIKKIIKYVSGTTEYSLWYTQDTPTSLVGYCDANWVGNS